MTLDYRPQISRRKLWRFLGMVAALSMLLGGEVYWFGPRVLASAHTRWHAWMMEREGRRRADADWAIHSPAKYVARVPTWGSGVLHGGPWTDIEVDPETGFRILSNFHEGWEPSYEARIDELLRQHGKPSWWAPPFPNENALVEIWHNNLFSTMAVDDFADFQRETSVKTWILRDGKIQIPDTTEWMLRLASPELIRHDSAYPNVHFVQSDLWENARLLVVADDGRILATVDLQITPLESGVRR